MKRRTQAKRRSIIGHKRACPARRSIVIHAPNLVAVLNSYPYQVISAHGQVAQAPHPPQHHRPQPVPQAFSLGLLEAWERSSGKGQSPPAQGLKLVSRSRLQCCGGQPLATPGTSSSSGRTYGSSSLRTRPILTGADISARFRTSR